MRAGSAERLVAVLTAGGSTLATCESLTGGAIGASIAAIAGASAVFRGGLVTYATDLKVELLGIDRVQLDRVGVVSEQAAVWMAEGARRVCGAEWGVSATGVAGPAWVDDQPPGRVFIGIAGPGVSGHRIISTALCFDFVGGREAVQAATVEEALNEATRFITQKQT